MTEQPLPKPGGRPVTPEVRRLLDEREAKGIATYGRPLETENGRSFLQDLTEELADGLQYAVGLRMELEEVWKDAKSAQTFALSLPHTTKMLLDRAVERIEVILGKAE